MNEEGLAEKTIARTIQLMYKNLMQTGEEFSSINNTLDRVAYREEVKSDPDAGAKSSKSPTDPQNITEAMERLLAMSNNLIREAENTRRRIDKIF